MIRINNRDLFVEEEETLGGLEDQFILSPSQMIILKNFDLNSTRNDLLKVHQDILRERVAPFLKNNSMGFAEIYAMTDRSGTRQVNYQVSTKRLAMVRLALLRFGVPFTKVFHGFAKAIGEDFWEFRSNQFAGKNPVFQNGLRDSAFRSVSLALSPSPFGFPVRQFLRPTFSEMLRFCRKHVQRRN